MVVSFEFEYDPFLPRTSSTEIGYELDEKYKRLAIETFGADKEENLEQLIQEFLSEIHKLDFYVPTSRPFCMKLLRAGKLDVQIALKKLKKYVKYMEKNKLFDSITMTSLKEVMSHKILTILPIRDQFGRRIIYVRLENWHPSVINYNTWSDLLYILFEILGMEPKTQIAGLSAIVDTRNFKMTQFKSITLAEAKFGSTIGQDNYPQKFAVIHNVNFINVPSVFLTALKVVQPFFTKETKEKFIFHENEASLHKKISPEVLPKCIGGQLDDAKLYECYDTVENMGEFLEELKSFGQKK